MAWWRALDRRGRHAFRGAFLGYALDSYDFWVLPLGLAAIALTFDLSDAQSGCWPPRPWWPAPSAGSSAGSCVTGSAACGR